MTIMYFNSEKLFKNLQKVRKHYVEITVDAASGEERVLCGTLCFSESTGRYQINEGESASEYLPKNINLNKVKRIFVDGVAYTPNLKKMETENGEKNEDELQK